MANNIAYLKLGNTYHHTIYSRVHSAWFNSCWKCWEKGEKEMGKTQGCFMLCVPLLSLHCFTISSCKGTKLSFKSCWIQKGSYITHFFQFFVQVKWGCEKKIDILNLQKIILSHTKFYLCIAWDPCLGWFSISTGPIISLVFLVSGFAYEASYKTSFV